MASLLKFNKIFLTTYNFLEYFCSISRNDVSYILTIKVYFLNYVNVKRKFVKLPMKKFFCSRAP